MVRQRHPNKEIENAIRHAEEKGWRYRKVGGSAHAWGRLLCPLHEREGCSLSIWSTPRNCELHARQIRKYVDGCPHLEGELVCKIFKNINLR